jgi:hypothetical protein
VSVISLFIANKYRVCLLNTEFKIERKKLIFWRDLASEKNKERKKEARV